MNDDTGQPQTNGRITRAEFEARHAALAAQVAQNEARVFAEQASLKECRDRKSTRLNSSHTVISYAVFCLKNKRNVKSRRQTLGCGVLIKSADITSIATTSSTNLAESVYRPEPTLQQVMQHSSVGTTRKRK